MASETRFSIAVVGAGGWGTAVASLLASRHDVILWARDPKLASEIAKTRQNSIYLPGVSLNPQLAVTSRLEDLQAQKIFLIAVPSFAMRPISQSLQPILGHSAPDKILISLTKGVEYGRQDHRLHTMACVIAEELNCEKIFSLSGPSFAIEVALGLPTTVVLAGSDLKEAERLQRAMTTQHFRVYTSDDLIGVELGGTFKNVIALAAGISDGLGFGDNAKGALISRGLVEMARLGALLGARKETFFGLAGLGDLVITAMSVKSRNHAVGVRIGRGEALDSIIKSMEQVAEGVYAARAIHQFALYEKLDLPITRGVYEVLYERASPLKKLSELMSREPKREEI